MTSAFLIIGSNTAPEKHMRAAIERLREQATVLAVSSVYETAAQGSGTGTYWNAAVRLDTEADPAAFKRDVLRVIERDLGRDRATPASVPIDLDIALWGEMPLDYGDKPWHSPSADILRYAFAAVPLAELSPDLIHPETGQTLAQIAAGFNRSALRRLDARIA
jgi:2-amino-4-hydroxy-6-hydroxymethyldihydropteridine diphosphokinase